MTKTPQVNDTNLGIVELRRKLIALASFAWAIYDKYSPENQAVWDSWAKEHGAHSIRSCVHASIEFCKGLDLLAGSDQFKLEEFVRGQNELCAQVLPDLTGEFYAD